MLNNPLSYTDPSGFFFKAIGNFVGKYWRQLVAVGIGIVTAGIASGAIWASLALNSAASFGVAVAGGALAGYVSPPYSSKQLKNRNGVSYFVV